MMFKSTIEKPIRFPVKEGFMLTNASVMVRPGCGQIMASVCAMNKYLAPEGGFWPLPPGTPYEHTDARNITYLAYFNHDLDVAMVREIATPPSATPTPTGKSFRGFRGFESGRLFGRNDQLWMTLCASGCGATPEAEFYMARIDEGKRVPAFTDVRRVIGDPAAPSEKNFMPDMTNGELRLHYRLGTLVNPIGGLVPLADARQDFAHLNGGSQVIPYQDGGLCVVHAYTEDRRRTWQHFAKLDRAGRPLGISDAFQLFGEGLEVVIGMAYHPDGKRVILSYGRDDPSAGPLALQEQPFVATIDLDELRSVI